MRALALLVLSIGLTFGCTSKQNEETPAAQAPEAQGAEKVEATAPEAAVPAANAKCNFTVSSVSPGWTAYKTGEKLPVSGTFTKVTLSGAKTVETLATALTGLGLEIEGATVDSGQPARNATLAAAFFAKFAADTKFGGSTTGATGDETRGTIMATLDMNGVAKPIRLNYGEVSDGVLVAKAVIDMLDYSLQAPFDSLHKACEGLHTGKDGVSKTWTEVELTITAKIDKKCE